MINRTPLALITLRDFFAIEVLGDLIQINSTRETQGFDIYKSAYNVADQMLKARDVDPNPEVPE